MAAEEIPWDPNAWLGDDALVFCSPCTRGIWIDLCCRMYRRHTSVLAGTIDALARLARCTPEEMASAIAELRINGAADVEEEQMIFKVRSRRIARFYERKQRNRERALQRTPQKKGENGECSGGQPDLFTPQFTPQNGGQNEGGKGDRAVCVSSGSSSLSSEADPEDLHGRNKRLKQEADQLCAHYRAAWLSEFDPPDKIPPEVSTADFMTARKLVKRFGLPQAFQLVAEFVKDPDPFFRKQGHPLRLIKPDAYRSRAGPRASSVGYAAPGGHNEGETKVYDDDF